MSCGLKNVCLTSALPGASRNPATSAASTTTVLTVDTVAARRPPPPLSSPGPRPVARNVFAAGGPDPATSGLQRGDAGVDLQPLLRELVKRAVGLHLGQRLVHAGHQRVALGEDQPEVLTGAGEPADHGRALDLRGGDELG